MHTDRREKQKRDTCAGVSEIIGAILLVMVVVAAVGVIAVYLFSQPMPSKVPSLKFMTAVNGSKLYIYHNGGESMNVGEFSVLLDGVPKSYSISDGSSQWSLGKNLEVTISTVPQNVQIVYNTSSTGGSVLLGQASANVVNSRNVSPDRLPYLDCAATSNPACLASLPPETINTMYITNTTKKAIRFMQANQARGIIRGGATPTYHFNFTVDDDNSTILVGAAGSDTCAAGTIYYLKTGNKVGIVLTGSPDSFYIYGTGSQIWYMNVGNRNRLNFQIINQTRTATFAGNNVICNAYIGKYTNLDSTLDIITATTNVITTLKVNTTEYINGVNISTITLNHVKPIPNGLFLINYGAAAEPIFFVGQADSISGLTGPLGL